MTPHSVVGGLFAGVGLSLMAIAVVASFGYVMAFGAGLLLFLLGMVFLDEHHQLRKAAKK
jgi:hypothetical protein